MAITKEKFKSKLRNPESKLNETAADQYESILDKQADGAVASMIRQS